MLLIDIARLVIWYRNRQLLADKGRKMVFITILYNLKVNQVFYQLSVKPITSVSCQLNFKLFVSCQLKFWPFVGCQLTPSRPLILYRDNCVTCYDLRYADTPILSAHNLSFFCSFLFYYLKQNISQGTSAEKNRFSQPFQVFRILYFAVHSSR